MDDLAVLTGDIVGSQTLGPALLDRVFEQMTAEAQRVAGWSPVDPCLTRGRGDGWQLVTQGRFGLRAMLMMRAAVRSADKHADTRIAVAIGAGHVPTRTLADAHGPVFVQSGQLLDEMNRKTRLAWAERAVLPLVDHVVRSWTQRQAEVATWAFDLPALTQSEIASILNVTPQTVQGHWDSAGLEALMQLCANDEAEV